MVIVKKNKEKDDAAEALEPEELAVDLRNKSTRRWPPGTSSPWPAADAPEQEEPAVDMEDKMRA
eukprot:4835047-Heterocapsa_arctica.AAC.1